MAANGVVAHRWVTESTKLDGCGGFEVSKSDARKEDLHVLAVDDSHVDRKVIEQLLKVSSCKATVVDSGRRALQFLGLEGGGDNSSGGYNDLKVDLIITDYCMPEMTGLELLKKIKESSTFKTVPVVIMSSENVVSRIDRCLEEGAEKFLMKPVKLADVKRLKDFMTTREIKVNDDEQEKMTTSAVRQTTKKRRTIDGDDGCTAATSDEPILSPPVSLASASTSASASTLPCPSCSPLLDSSTIRRPKMARSE